MFNVEYYKVHDRWSLNFFRRMLLNVGSLWLWIFLRCTDRKEGSIFLRGMTSIETIAGINSIVFLCNYDNLTLKLHQEKRSYPDEGWIFIGRFKVGSVPGMSVALEASKKSIKIHHEYDARPLIKSYNCY